MLISKSANPTSINSRDFHSLLLATRPKTLVASLVPVLVATALAARAGSANYATALVCLLCSICLQIATNFINDASDFHRGADTEERLGPERMAQSGRITPNNLFVLGGVFIALAFIFGLYLVSVGGPIFLALGFAAMIAAVGYTAGPFPLAYHGLGDIFVFLFFGLAAVGGCYFLQTHQLTAPALLIAAMIGLHATTLIAVNNTRDIPTDEKVDKRTISVRLGAEKSKYYFVALVFLPYACIPLMVLLGWMGWGFLVALAPLPIAIARTRNFFQAKSGADFNTLLARTAQHQLAFTIAVCVGLALG